MSEIQLYQNEPPQGGWIDGALYDDFLRWAVAEHSASDIKLVPTSPIMLSISGQWWPATRRAPAMSEISAIIDYASRRKDTSARAMGGKSQDFSHEIAKVAGDRRSGTWRFRANATSCMSGASAGLSLTMRTIPDVIPMLSDLGVTDDLEKHLFPDHGLVSIAGVMGSGKTTTMAAIMRDIRTKTRRAVMTVEKPVEFDLSNIDGALGPIEQIEVPRMIESFQEGIISATRKAANVLLVGETNDRATMEAMIHAGEIGISVYHTLHTQSVSSIPTRIIHQFSAEEAPGVAVSFLSSVRVMIQQRLAPRVGGGRVALREWLVLDDNMRMQLIDTPTEKLSQALEKMVRTHGRPLIEEASDAHKAGLIDDRMLRLIELEKR